MWRIGIDTGGTFSDLVAVSDEQSWYLKVPSTPPHFEKGFLDALVRLGVDLGDVSELIHGTTVTTNATITRTGAHTGLITTAGFRDVLELRRHDRDEQYDLAWEPPEPLIARRDRLGVPERIDYAGRIITPLDESALGDAADLLRQRGVQAVAIVLINAYVNSVHEERAEQIVREILPDAYISISSRLNREINEFERTSTTVVNAYLGPIFRNYVQDLERELARDGYERPLLLMHSGGGLLPSSSVTDVPARTVNSGPAAGVMAAAEIARDASLARVISFDMGGTSSDISVVIDGQPREVTEFSPEFGVPIRFPSVDVVAIGAGGGSIGWIDEAGYPKVGPRSAGASPGPACYGAGGELPTVTDANVALGRLGAGTLLAGMLPLDRELAVASIKTHFADPLDMSVDDAAMGIIRIANTNMANAIHVATVQRGLDPREFALVAFGGAGPMHAVEVARELSIPKVLVPAAPGVTSARGLLGANVSHDRASTYIRPIDELDPAQIGETLDEMVADVQAALERDHIPADRRAIERLIDVRYVGQMKALTLRLPDVPLTRAHVPQLKAAFFERYEATYRYVTDDIPIEVSAVRVRGSGLLGRSEALAAPLTPLPSAGTSDHEPVTESLVADVCFAEGWQASSIHERRTLGAGTRIIGPAIVRQDDSTTVLPPGASLQVDISGNLVIAVDEV
jgi:N-methylhydantoinase A